MLNPTPFLSQEGLAIIFGALMALSVFIYVILDGYDLGVGVLLPLDNDEQADIMIASIGPFWDANETWLVLAVGLALIAFPLAHSMILQALYLPAAVMLIGLILRGVAFDFRTKARFSEQPLWNRVFKAGSIITALSQGYILGQYVMGFDESHTAFAFSLFSAVGVLAAYCLIGGAWLVMKTEGALQKKAVVWTRQASRIALGGIVLVSLVNPLINPYVMDKWFSMPYAVLLLPLPALCLLCLVVLDRILKQMPFKNDSLCWLPFTLATAVFLLSFYGLIYSFYPYIVPGELTLYDSVAAPESLTFLLWGSLVVIPVILIYTVFAYRVFWGKSEDLKYY